jgi:ubiquinone/menaquinone biosynthesis C-methylase UbiE
VSSLIDFDSEAAKMLERVYQTPDVLAQRARFHQLLSLRPGERVCDVGVGPGLLSFEMAQTVGENGRAAGIDQSEAMLEMTRTRCSELGWTDFRQADATKLPFEDESFDAVVSTQVYEYVPDMASALAEAHRVLRPGGRVLILDTDWDSVVWNTNDRARMQKIMLAWDDHLHDPHLPATLGPKLTAAGFSVYLREVIPLVNPTFQTNCYSFGISAAIRAFVADRDAVSADEAAAWRNEFAALDLAGEYFFSINRYVFAGIKRG